MSSSQRFALPVFLALLVGVSTGWGIAAWTAAGSRASVEAGPAQPGQARGAPASLQNTGALPDAQLALTGRTPVAAPAAGARRAADPGSTPESALLLRIGALEAQLESLRTELELERAHDGTPFESFLRTPDAATLSADQRKNVELLLEYLPVHLFAGEPTWLAENAMRPTGAGTWDTDDAAVLRFLGRDRVLRQLGLRQLAAAWDTIGGELPAALGMTRDEAVALREEIRAAGIEPRMFYRFGDEDL